MNVSHTVPEELGRRPGVYVVWVEARRPLRIAVGALGVVRFAAGHYLYVGSARGGLGARVSRYLRRRQRLFWHVDYLCARARVRGVWLRQGEKLGECQLAQVLLERLSVQQGPRGFGSSDCRCPTHLLFSRGSPARAFRASGLFHALVTPR